LPRALDVKTVQHGRHLVEVTLKIPRLLALSASGFAFGPCGSDGGGQAGFLLGKQVGSDPVVVEQPQQLPPLVLEILDTVTSPRSCNSA
jgi:hypothetical protein